MAALIQCLVRARRLSFLAVILCFLCSPLAQGRALSARLESEASLSGNPANTGDLAFWGESRNGLLCAADPVNHVDPSGNEYNLTSLNASIATGLRISAQVGVRAGRALTKARRFFWDNRKFDAVRKAYWKANGPANGRSLHHWLIPQRMSRIPQGLRNAGFNLLELPKVLSGNLGLNQWMGFAVKWGGYRMVIAYTIENGIKIAIPLAIYEAATIGTDNSNGEPEVEQFELKPSDWEDDRGFEDLRGLTADDDDLVTGFETAPF